MSRMEHQMTPKLLGTTKTSAFLKTALSSKADQAKLAVAYWGEGAARELGLSKRTVSTRIICDLWSGRCNPDEIKSLLSYGAIIRTLDKLHAKVYWTPTVVVIGSNNASTNGLGFEGSEARSNVELSAAIYDREFVETVRNWFEEQWAKSEPVDCESAEDARPFWEAAQRDRPTQSSKTLLRGLAQGSLRLRNASIWVAAHSGIPPERPVQRVFQNEGRRRYTDRELREVQDYYPYYQDTSGCWPVEPGHVILDFELKIRSGLPEFGGMWRVRSDPFIAAPTERYPRSRIVLCDMINDYRGMRLPQREAALIGKAISAHLKACKRRSSDTCPGYYDFLLWKALKAFWEEHKSRLSQK
jgi:PLD-like domain